LSEFVEAAITPSVVKLPWTLKPLNSRSTAVA